MTKQELLNFVQGLPDNAVALPIDLTECVEDAGPWERNGELTDLGAVYQRSVKNTVTLRLLFKTREQGEFLRTYTDPDGTFRNLRRIS